MAIISLLVSLLLPAVQSARDEARRSQSANNLKQIGLALHEFEGVHKLFPPGYSTTPYAAGQPLPPSVDPDTYDAPPGWAWGAYLLPFLDEDSLFQQLNFNLPCTDPANATAVQTPVVVYRCPGATSDSLTITIKHFSSLPPADLTNYSVMATFGRSGYVANAGQNDPWGDPIPDWSVLTGLGPLYRNSKTRGAKVTDGLSSTVFIGEHVDLSDKTWVGVVPFSNEVNNDPVRWPDSDGGWDMAGPYVLCHSGPATDEDPPVIHPPNYPSHHVDQMEGPWNADGGNVLFGDGHVTFIVGEINLNTWWALSTISMGEVVDGSYDD